MAPNIQEKVVSWHRETFPNATNEAIEEKLIEEAEELIEALRYKKQHCIIEEIADVVIVSCALLGRFSADLSTVTLEKLTVNKNRNWGKETENGDRPRRK